MTRSSRFIGALGVLLSCALARSPSAARGPSARIVAAVRFRSTLPQTKDAIFLFMAIGIGLASGVQLGSVAYLGSIVFNLTLLLVSAYGFAQNPPRVEGLRLQPRPEKKGRKKTETEVAASEPELVAGPGADPP